MLTAAQITAGSARLESGKLSQSDVDQLVSVFRMFFGSLETKYSYQFESKLEDLDDTGNAEKKAAQVAACIIKMEELGFGVASLVGELNYKEKDEYQQYVIIAFSKLYPLPDEMSKFLRYKSTPRSSQSADSCRHENFGGGYRSSEQFRRRRW